MSRTRALVWMVAVLAVAWAARWFVIAGPLATLESDESVPGLMALHVLRGERPVFYWGQAYLGALEVYPTAALFRAAGVSPFTLKFVPAATSLLFVVTLYRLGRAYFGRPVGLLSAGLASVSLLLVVRGVKATGYGPVFLLGNLALWQVRQQRVERGPRPRRQAFLAPALLGLLCGLLFWAHPLGLVYIVPIGLWLVQRSLALARARRLRVGRFLGRAAAVAVGALAGLAPALAENVRTGWATLRLLSGAGAPAGGWLSRLADFRVTFPIVLGFFQPTSHVAGFWQGVDAHKPAYWAGLLLGLGLALFCLVELVRALVGFLRTGEARPEWLLLYVVVATCAFAALSRFSSLTEPRYLLPLFSALPVFVRRCVLPDTGRALLCWAGRLGYAGLLALNVAGLARLDPRLNLPYLDGQPYPASLAPLIDELDREGVDAAYADYWICYRLMFETRERIRCAVLLGLKPGWDRRWEYAAAVREAPSPAWVFVAGSEPDRAFRQRLERDGIAYARAEPDGYAVYSALGRRVLPGP